MIQYYIRKCSVIFNLCFFQFHQLSACTLV